MGRIDERLWGRGKAEPIWTTRPKETRERPVLKPEAGKVGGRVMGEMVVGMEAHNRQKTVLVQQWRHRRLVTMVTMGER